MTERHDFNISTLRRVLTPFYIPTPYCCRGTLPAQAPLHTRNIFLLFQHSRAHFAGIRFPHTVHYCRIPDASAAAARDGATRRRSASRGRSTQAARLHGAYFLQNNIGADFAVRANFDTRLPPCCRFILAIPPHAARARRCLHIPAPPDAKVIEHGISKPQRVTCGF